MPNRVQLLLSNNPIVSQAQLYMNRQQYLSFCEYMEQNFHLLSGEDLGEMHLMRAQIKIFYGDETMLDDLRAARKLLPDGSRLPTVGSRYRSDSPALFVVFDPEGGALTRYRTALGRAIPLLDRLCGGVSADLVRLYEAELLYTIGYFERSKELALPIYRQAVQDKLPYIAFTAGYSLVRACTALGELATVEEVITQFIRYTKILSQPHYRQLYEYVMVWVNCTTSWMGEMPRFHISREGEEIPILEYRMRAMREGATDYNIFEEAIISTAQRYLPHAYSTKSLYGGIYDAMVYFKIGERSRAATRLYEMYQLTQKNRIISPFVEYGTQILPLLQYALGRKDGGRFARRWADKIIHMATRYEESLRIIRGETEVAQAVMEKLEEADLEVLQLLVKGLTINEVADQLDADTAATRDRIRELYRKMGVHNRSQAIARAVGAKLVEVVSEGPSGEG